MIEVLNAAAQAWWQWMGPMLWQVSLLIVIVGTIDRLIRNRARPEVRQALWMLVLVKLMIPPGWSMPAGLIPHIAEPMKRVATARIEAWGARDAPRVDPLRDTTDEVPAIQSHALVSFADAGPSHRAAPRESVPIWQAYALLVWLTGMAVISALLLARVGRLRRWHREQDETRTVPPWFLDLMVSAAQQLKLERLPAIVFSNEVAAPAVYGLFHPVLLLPTDTESLSREDAAHVLLHELAHLKRGDLWWHGLCLTLQIVYWFNPLLIWARRQNKHVRELCCDLTVASVLREKTREYRKTLLDTARRLLSESTEPALALLGVFEEPFRLVSRLRWLERETWHRRTPAVASAIMVLVLGVPLLLPMAAATDKGSLDVGHHGPSDDNGRQLTSSAASQRPQGREKNMPAVYVRNEVEYADLFLGIPVRTRVGAISELWVGREVIAATENGKTFIVDRARTQLTYIDHEHRFWTTTPLPLEVDRAMCEHSLARRHEMRSSGEVAATGRSRRILEKTCAEYAVHSWRIRGDSRIDNEERFKVWATTDVPFDLSLYDELLHNIRLIYNRDAVYRSELEKIRGLQMTLEISDGNFLATRRITDHVVVLEIRAPAPDVFAPPEGYQRRDRIEDFEM